MKITERIRSGFDAVFHPASCDLCGSYHESPLYWLCDACWQQTKTAPIPEKIDLPVGADDAVVAHFGWHFQAGIQQVIYCLKYQKHHSIAMEVGRNLRLRLAQTCDFSQIDFIVPVPLHKKRKAWRGFNQSELIARGILQAKEKLQIADALKRLKMTEMQAMLNPAERLLNVCEAFAVKPGFGRRLADASVVLLDDVVTTGATASACIAELRNAGVRKIQIIAVAHAGGDNQPVANVAEE